MKPNTKTRYGILAMLDLALNYETGPVNLKKVAAHQQLPAKYLENLLALLRTAGLVRGIRGRKGGHLLARRPDQITLREIYAVLESSEGFANCTTDPQVCDRYELCAVQEVWDQMYVACMEVLESTTLEDLARRTRQKRGSLALTYQI